MFFASIELFSWGFPFLQVFTYRNNKVNDGRFSPLPVGSEREVLLALEP
jgi:hypothetical protein